MLEIHWLTAVPLLPSVIAVHGGGDGGGGGRELPGGYGGGDGGCGGGGGTHNWLQHVEQEPPQLGHSAQQPQKFGVQ